MKFYLHRVHLNQGGYESDGTYWGTGMPLYHYFHEWGTSPDEYVEDWVRAHNRDDAKARVIAKYPNAKFSR